MLGKSYISHYEDETRDCPIIRITTTSFQNNFQSHPRQQIATTAFKCQIKFSVGVKAPVNNMQVGNANMLQQ